MRATIPRRSMRWHAELIVRSSGCHRARAFDQDSCRKHQKSSRVGDADRALGIRAVPPDGSDNTFDIQVGVERPAEVIPRFPGEVLTENNVARAYLRGADFERWGVSEGCLGWYLSTGQGPQQARSVSCRRGIEALLRGGPSGSARLAVAQERFNRALADAVKRSATKDLRT